MTPTPDEHLAIDATVAVKWVVAEPGNERATRLRQHSLIAPDLLFPECANVLWRKVRRREITDDEAVIAAQTLEQSDVVVVPTRGYMARAVAMAVELDHPAYDVMYLAVAEAFGLRLVTADDRLIRKTEQGAARYRNMLLPLSDIAPAGYSA